MSSTSKSKMKRREKLLSVGPLSSEERNRSEQKKRKLGLTESGQSGVSVKVNILPKPIPPDFDAFKLSEEVESSENEIRNFWRKYTDDVEKYNHNVIAYWMGIISKKEEKEMKGKDAPESDADDDDVDLPRSLQEETTWLSRLTELVRTHFETNKFVVTRNEYSHWYQPTYLDLSGPLGSLSYFRRKGEKDIFEVNGAGSFKFGDVVFKLGIFNYFERSKKFRDVLSSGHRFKFSSDNIEEDTFTVFAEPYAGKTRVSIQFVTLTDDDKRVLNLIVSKKIKPERVNSYLCHNSEGWIEYVIDIPIPPKILTPEVDVYDGNIVQTLKSNRICAFGELTPSPSEDEDENVKTPV